MNRQERITLAKRKAAIERPKHEKWIYDDKGVIAKIITEDVEPILGAAKYSRNYARNGFTLGNDFRKLGTVPLIFYDKWIREHGRECLLDPKFIKKKLNEFNGFRATDRMV